MSQLHLAQEAKLGCVMCTTDRLAVMVLQLFGLANLTGAVPIPMAAALL